MPSNITEEDIAMLKEIFVTKETCDQRDHSNAKYFTKIEVMLAQQGTKLSLIMGVLSAIGVAIGGVLVKYLFS